MLTTPFNQDKLDEFYYDLIDEKGPSVLLFGESSEQWTNQTLNFFTKNGIPIYFFGWSNAIELRLQLELIRYPVIQLWGDKKLNSEIIGYKEEALEKLAKSYFKLKKG